MAPAPRFTNEEEEKRVLDAAAQCVAESSLLDFKMSGIASYAGISMGSVYKHVRSKEDVLVALETRNAMTAFQIISSLLTLPLSAPERLVACLLIDPIKVQPEPYAVHLEMLISNQAILQKASARWVDKLAEIDRSIQMLFIEWLKAEPELMTEEAMRETQGEELMVGIWSMLVGFKQVALHRNALSINALKVPLPFPLSLNHSLIRNAKSLLNAYPWKLPLTDVGLAKTIEHLNSLGYR